MGANYVLINEQTLNANAASVTFSSIPQTGYTDLVIKVSARTSDNNQGQVVNVAFNGSSSNISAKIIYGDGGSAASTTSTSNLFWTTAAGATASTFGNAEVYIPNYTSSNAKSWSSDSVTENNGSTAYTTMIAGLWNPGTQAAITTIALTPGASASFVAGSSFSLYGIAAVGTTPTVVPKASGGDIIKNDGTYWYHAFLSSGTFTPNTNLSCDYLVVAGGGGGASGNGGGGGAGGLRSTVTATGGGGSLESKLSLTGTTSYAITVGSGGAGGAGGGENRGTSGTTSSISTISSVGGGGGGGTSGVALTGGSGGGGAANNTAGAAGTSIQGYAGGTSNPTAPNYPSAGGGGAGAVGSANPNSTTGGNGGAGVAISAFASATGTGVSNYYAGGGGGGLYNGGTGGTGGAGGGGNAATSTSTAGTAGTINTGSGGGASWSGGTVQVGGNGGSGIVIVRYAMA